MRKRNTAGQFVKSDPLPFIENRLGEIQVTNKYKVNKRYHAHFICHCGKKFSADYYSITSKHSISCGCYRKKQVTNATHNMSNSREYESWSCMLSRCNNPRTNRSKSYVLKGITYAKEWSNFENFYKDMGNRPIGTSLDRIDNDKGYTKSNCRWATNIEQARNKSNTKYVVYEGKKMPMIEVCDILKLNYNTLNSRLNRGATFEEAITKPIRGRTNHAS